MHLALHTNPFRCNFLFFYRVCSFAEQITVQFFPMENLSTSECVLWREALIKKKASTLVFDKFRFASAI